MNFNNKPLFTYLSIHGKTKGRQKSSGCRTGLQLPASFPIEFVGEKLAGSISNHGHMVIGMLLQPQL